MKALSDDCERFISFPPGHLYSSKTGERRLWNPKMVGLAQLGHSSNIRLKEQNQVHLHHLQVF
ncbi:hypothetical protein BRADI_2g41675v3 [Brachypodium distachyon]|uniref:Uncharacterized protein n=1 Tax=Brachypodium distachyon TaxID=15368 RepID=A0A0Q3J741_BRADI|nr:hypothetical protein BRADI_2g41675v3 [Brachypodium distachyon]